MTPHEETILTLNSIVNALNAILVILIVMTEYDHKAVQDAIAGKPAGHGGPKEKLLWLSDYLKEAA